MSPDENPQDPAIPPKSLSFRGTLALGIYLLALALILAFLVYKLWPIEILDDEGNKVWKQFVMLFGKRFRVPNEVRFILLVMVTGALGSYIHAATSFATYVGNRRLTTSWVWWYILRAPIGSALALLFYFLIRGGIFSAGAGANDISVYGIAAIAGLVGMFSKQATDKMEELFKTLFKTEPGTGDALREDKLENPAPSITGIEPSTVKAGSVDASITIKGNNFMEDSVAQVNGSNRRTEFQSKTQLIAHLENQDTASPGSIKVTVLNPPPSGGTSSPITLKVE